MALAVADQRVGFKSVVTTTFGYDAFGARVYQIASTTATSTYPFKWYSIASTTRTGANYATSTEYIFNGDTLLSTVDQAFKNGATAGSAAVRYVHPDHLGSTEVVTDANQNLVQTLDYYPYGATRISVSTSTNEKRRYIDQFTDDSGLIYDNARYYNPTQGQFLSEEPIFQSLGDANQVSQLAGQTQQSYLTDPQVLNSYSYGRDNPITNKDTNGRRVELVSRPIDGIIGGGFAHTFLYVMPDNPKTVGSIPGVNTSQPFTLSGIPRNGQLMKTANYSQDYFYAACGSLCPAGASVTIAPPPGVSSAQFDANVVTSYNNAPSDFGSYPFLGWGTPRAFGTPNSNNAATTFLMGAGVNQNRIYQYKDSMMFNGNGRFAPGLGVSATAPTYRQQVLSQLTSVLNAASAYLKGLAGK